MVSGQLPDDRQHSFSQGTYAKLQIWKWKSNKYCFSTQDPFLPFSFIVELQSCSGIHSAPCGHVLQKWALLTNSKVRPVWSQDNPIPLTEIGWKTGMWLNFGQWFLKGGLLRHHWKGFSLFRKCHRKTWSLCSHFSQPGDNVNIEDSGKRDVKNLN